ncbi:MAG: glycosyltransferase family 2 protein, partial [Pseudomonadota bacterium]
MAEVAVLLATYNGARFLREQIESLYRQTHEDWTLLASDDGSTDATRDILTRIASDRLTDLREGPRQGASANFLSLLARVPRGSYAAFCDQDDVWEPEKLTRALALLPDPTTPALYCARTQVCDASLTPITLSKRPLRGLSIENALVQNVASGNTLVLTPAAVQHLQAMPAPEPCPAHDWWCYLALAATGAELIYDPWPCLAYRQHGANTLGASLGPLAKLSRLQATRRGDL